MTASRVKPAISAGRKKKGARKRIPAAPDLPTPCPPGHGAIARAVDHLTQCLSVRLGDVADAVDELADVLRAERGPSPAATPAWVQEATQQITKLIVDYGKLRYDVTTLTDLMHANLERLRARVSRLEVTAYGSISCICQNNAEVINGHCGNCGRVVAWAEQRQATEDSST